MITYNTNDLVLRAKELADLESSSFIGWHENICLLNESYNKLYQTAINHNDRYWITTWTLDSSSYVQIGQYERAYALPDDFWQLYSVNLSDDSTPILRKSVNEDKSMMRYDIENGNLIIYGATNANITIKYFPVPQTLTLSAEDSPQTNIPDNVLDCCENKYLYYTSPNFHIYDISTDTDYTLSGSYSGNISFATLGKTSALFSDGTNVHQIDLTNGTISSATGLIGKKGNNVFLYNNGTLSECIKGSTRSCATGIVIPSTTWDTGATFTFNDDITVMYMPYNGYIWAVGTDSTTMPSTSYMEYTEPVIEFIGGHLYCVEYDVYEDGVVIIPAESFGTYIGINKVSSSTGYGVSVYDVNGDGVVKSVFINTILNFPNNFYFTLISYYLAIAYKAKQNADSTALVALATSEEFNFYNTMNRDINNVTRIRNDYASGSLY